MLRYQNQKSLLDQLVKTYLVKKMEKLLVQLKLGYHLSQLRVKT